MSVSTIHGETRPRSCRSTGFQLVSPRGTGFQPVSDTGKMPVPRSASNAIHGALCRICRLVFVAFVACLLSRDAWAGAEISGVYWHMTPSGSAAVGFEDLAGTEVDLEDDFGYDDTEAVLGARVIIGEQVQFGASFFGLDMSSQSRIAREVRFEDTVFAADANVASAIDATFIRAFARFEFGNEEIRGGFLAGGQYIDLEASASAEGFGDADAKTDAGMPILGVHVEWSPHEALRLRASVVGGDWELDDIDVAFFDYEATVHFVPHPSFFIGAGYRHIDIDGEDGDTLIEADLTFSGPIAVAGCGW